MLAILGSALFSVAYGRTFATQELFSTGFSVTIDVGADSTTVDVVADATVWHGVGFGGLSMSAGTSASIYEGSEQLDTRYFSQTGAGTSLGAFWTVSNYAETNGVVSYSMMRDNDITDTCSQCFVFNASATTLEIIMARGDTASLGYHDTSGNGNAAGYRLTAAATTPAPTTTTTTTTAAPTTSAGTLVREFATQELDTTGFSVTVRMYTQSTSIDVSAPINRWHSVGFGGTSMADGLNGFLWMNGDAVEDVTISSTGFSIIASTSGKTWTVSDYVESNNAVTYTMMRDNDITDLCADCYVFDMDATSIDIIMARANTETFELGYHGPSYLVADEDTPDSAATYTLTEGTTTTTTSAMPTVSPAPTVSTSVGQTPSPVTMGPATVFATQELDTTAFSVSVSVGAESTSIDVMAPINRWHSVGFGGTSMADNLNGFTYTGTDTLDDVIISQATGLTSLGTFWTVSDYVEGVNGVTYTMMRSNDITDVCADCYVFDMDATSIDIIMARANTETFTLGYHGASYQANTDDAIPDSAATYTLTAQTDSSGAGQIKAGLVMVAALFTFLWL